MDDLENRLRRALERREPPASFRARVYSARARRAEVPRRRIWLGWAAAFASLVAVGGGVAWQHERNIQERAAGEVARQKLELALKITKTKLRDIGRQIESVQENN